MVSLIYIEVKEGGNKAFGNLHKKNSLGWEKRNGILQYIDMLPSHNLQK